MLLHGPLRDPVDMLLVLRGRDQQDVQQRLLDRADRDGNDQQAHDGKDQRVHVG